MPAFLTGLPVWVWLVWVALIFLTAIVVAPRRRTAPQPRRKRLMQISGQVLLGAAMVIVRAETAPIATLLAALGGAIYGNASGSERGRHQPATGEQDRSDGARSAGSGEPGDDLATELDDEPDGGTDRPT
jgi:hypothetical protein